MNCLACARGGQAQSMDRVVEARLHQLYKRRTGRLGVIQSSLEDASKLTLAHAVEETCLLLFLKLEQIFGAAASRREIFSVARRRPIDSLR